MDSVALHLALNSWWDNSAKEKQKNKKTGQGLNRDLSGKDAQMNANENHGDPTAHPSGWLLPKTGKITSVGKGVESLEPLRTVGGGVAWCGFCGKPGAGSWKT